MNSGFMIGCHLEGLCVAVAALIEDSWRSFNRNLGIGLNECERVAHWVVVATSSL